MRKFSQKSLWPTKHIYFCNPKSNDVVKMFIDAKLMGKYLDQFLQPDNKVLRIRRTAAGGFKFCLRNQIGEWKPFEIPDLGRWEPWKPTHLHQTPIVIQNVEKELNEDNIKNILINKNPILQSMSVEKLENLEIKRLSVRKKGLNQNSEVQSENFNLEPSKSIRIFLDTNISNKILDTGCIHMEYTIHKVRKFEFKNKCFLCKKEGYNSKTCRSKVSVNT